MPNNLKGRGAIKPGAFWPVWPYVWPGGETINIGWGPAGTIQSNSILRVEWGYVLYNVQCAERTIDKFRNATNWFIAQLPRPLASPPGLPSMWAGRVGLNLPNMCCSNSITFGTNLFLILHMLPHLLVCQIRHSPEPIGRACNSLEPFGKQHSVLSTQMQNAALSSFGQGVSGQDGGRLSAISLRGKCTLRRYFCNNACGSQRKI